LVEGIGSMLLQQHQALLVRAQQYHTDRTEHFDDRDSFNAYFARDKPGFATAYYAEDEAIEKELKKALAVTARCLPLDVKEAHGACLFAPHKKGRLTVFAKAY